MGMVMGVEFFAMLFDGMGAKNFLIMWLISWAITVVSVIIYFKFDPDKAMGSEIVIAAILAVFVAPISAVITFFMALYMYMTYCKTSIFNRMTNWLNDGK